MKDNKKEISIFQNSKLCRRSRWLRRHGARVVHGGPCGVVVVADYLDMMFAYGHRVNAVID